MKVHDKILEITGGQYHYKKKQIDGLLELDVVDYVSYKDKNKAIHAIQTPTSIKKHGSTFQQCLLLSYTTSGENKGSWRIALSIRNIYFEERFR